MANTSRMNRLEELGRVDSEKAKTSKGKKNLMAEKSRITSELSGGGMKKMSKGGLGTASKMGPVKTAAPSKDGVATKGKTRGKQIKMGSTVAAVKGASRGR